MNNIFASLTTFFWLSKLMSTKSKVLICFASLISMSSGYITSFIPKTIGKLLDLYTDQKAIIMTLTILGVLYLLNELTSVLKRLIVERIATNFFRTLTVIAADKILHLDINFIQNQKSGSINFKVQNSVSGSTKLVKLFFMDIIPSLFIMSFAIGFAFYQSWIVGFVLLLILPINILVILMQLNSQRGVRVGLIRSQEEIHGNIVEMISGIEETRVANYEKEQIVKIEKSAVEISKTEFKHHKGMIRYDFTKGSLKWFFHIVILAISLYMALHNYISIGSVLTYSLLYMASMKPIEEIHRYLDELQENSIKANDLKEIFEQYPIDQSFEIEDNISTESENVESKENYPYSIEVKDLSFRFKGTNGNNVFSNLTFKVKKSLYIGIVGESGCGKSTLIKNILKIYQGEGRILINGSDLIELSRKRIAEQIIYVPQVPFIFNGTLRENITFGSKDRLITDDQIMEAIMKAHLLTYINSLPVGLNTVITERGTNLSGGQKQRISLSRVFLNNNKKIVILDEATSAMDNQTEALIYESLLSTDRTIISIAHRLNTLKNANLILVMNRIGEIVQQGTFTELLDQPGIFSQMAHIYEEN